VEALRGGFQCPALPVAARAVRVINPRPARCVAAEKKGVKQGACAQREGAWQARGGMPRAEKARRRCAVVGETCSGGKGAAQRWQEAW